MKDPIKIPISLVVVALNEEKNIARLLKSAQWVQDIVVLDSGSHDKTCEIARTLGARVFNEPWRGFGPQKKRAVELAAQDWILSLDADEKISPELEIEIKEKWSSLNPEVGYKLPRKSWYLGRWILHGGWFPDAQLRLFHRKYSNWDDALIHEKVISSHHVVFNSCIEHYVFQNISDQIQTNNKYSSLQAQELRKNGISFCWGKLMLKPISKFIECYFFKRGFLDGFPGFFIAVGAAYSVFLRWSKLWELEKESQ